MGYTQKIGKHAEDLAYQYLHKQGLRLLERNFNTRFGEIDLVMRDNDTTVFVEVRYRHQPEIVDPLSSIDSRKQLKLIRTARYYLQQHRNHAFAPARFDVIAITDQGEQPQIQWIKNAFEAQGT
ncbi:MAG: YraN family protein [Gammaproteobacteria bacterium]|nr:YraN family protein [Gammaproteobacteria bacterium]